MLSTCASEGLTPACCIAYRSWKCEVDTKGVPIFLPLRSAIVLMPLPLRATSASAPAISSRIQNRSTSMPWLIAVAIPVDPTSPSCTSPDAIARVTSPPPPPLRRDAVAAPAELAPADLEAGRFLHFLLLLYPAPRIHHVLIGERHGLLCPRRRSDEHRRRDPHQSCQQAFHAPSIV